VQPLIVSFIVQLMFERVDAGKVTTMNAMQSPIVAGLFVMPFNYDMSRLPENY